MAENYATSRKKIPAAEKKLLASVLDMKREVPTLDSALGLMNPADRAEIPMVAKREP